MIKKIIKKCDCMRSLGPGQGGKTKKSKATIKKRRKKK